MDGGQRLIGSSADLKDGGSGLRFAVERGGETLQGFAIRYDGKAYAYLNRCAHVGIELDWVPGQFFDSGGLYLMCATHGAAYEPETGRCVWGPCKGAGLIPLPVVERGGELFIIE